MRETGGIWEAIINDELRKAGLDPKTDVTWVEDRIFAYHDNPAHVEAIRDRKVDCAASSPPFAFDLQKMGCTLLLSTKRLFQEGRPERVIAARAMVAGEKREELRKFLRAILRAFWFERNPDNFAYLTDMEKRLRAASPSEDERVLRQETSLKRFEGRSLPVDGRVSPEGLKQIVDEMKGMGELRQDFAAEGALRDEAVKDAFKDLLARKELESEWRRVCQIVEKWGY